MGVDKGDSASSDIREEARGLVHFSEGFYGRVHSEGGSPDAAGILGERICAKN